MTPEQKIASLELTVTALQAEVRASSDGDTIRELRAQVRELEYARDGGQGWVRM